MATSGFMLGDLLKERDRESKGGSISSSSSTKSDNPIDNPIDKPSDKPSERLSERKVQQRESGSVLGHGHGHGHGHGPLTKHPTSIDRNMTRAQDPPRSKSKIRDVDVVVQGAKSQAIKGQGLASRGIGERGVGEAGIESQSEVGLSDLFRQVTDSPLFRFFTNACQQIDFNDYQHICD
jgi:hypothetical protein